MSMKGSKVKQPTAADYKKTAMTKQSFRDSTDINKILAKAQVTGTVSHITKHQGEYGDFAEFDFLQAQINIARGREIFDALPSEIRTEFNQSPSEFFEFVNDPENRDRLEEVLPALAEPGRQNIDVSRLSLRTGSTAAVPDAADSDTAPPDGGENSSGDASGGDGASTD